MVQQNETQMFGTGWGYMYIHRLGSKTLSWGKRDQCVVKLSIVCVWVGWGGILKWRCSGHEYNKSKLSKHSWICHLIVGKYFFFVLRSFTFHFLLKLFHWMTVRLLNKHGAIKTGFLTTKHFIYLFSCVILLSLKTKGLVQMYKSMQTEISIFTLGSKVGTWMFNLAVKLSQNVIAEQIFLTT